LTSEIEERIHEALGKHPLERIGDGYRVVHPGGVGTGTLRLLPVDRDGECPRVLSIVEITAEYLAPALRRFHPAGVQRLNALSLHGAFDLQGDLLVQKAQLSIYSNEVSAPFMAWLALTAFGQQLPLGQSTALATASAAVLEQQRAHHGLPRQWNQPISAESLQATVASLHSRGLAASHNEKAVWAEVPLSGTCPSRSIDPQAETALLQVNVGTPHPIAGAGYLASLSLPWPKAPADPAGTCRRLNELEMARPDFVPRLGAWGLHGPDDVPRYTCFIPSPEPFVDLHSTMIWWQAVRAAWIRDELWVAGEGLDFAKLAPAAAPAPAA